MKSKNEVRIEFGKRLQRIRKVSGLSQEMLAKAMNTRITSVSHWEQGISGPNLDQLASLARYFHVSTDYLLGLGDEDYDLNFDEYDFYNEVEELHGKDIENEN